MPQNQPPRDDFDIAALFQALDAQRIERQLSWQDVADQIWNLSDMLNAQRNDHPISPATLKGMTQRMNTSCPHALFMLRWLDRAPYKEAVLVQAKLVKNSTLKVYPGYPHGMLTVHADVINPDLLAFIKS
jgi:hypothetical protein